MKLNDKVYDVLKWIVMIVLPATTTCYVALAPVWGWPRPDDVALTLNAITAFIGALLGAFIIPLLPAFLRRAGTCPRYF